MLRELGYEKLRLYAGGIADWKEHHGPVEGLPASESLSQDQSQVMRSSSDILHLRIPTLRRDLPTMVIDAMGACSIRELFLFWLWMTAGFGFIYWIAGFWDGHGLRAGTLPIETNWNGLATAVYFSFVTALSIGYGDVLPLGLARILAVVEGMGGLLIFGCVISKLVSKRQEKLIEEIHRITFEDRLGRIRTNLHLVLSELQAIAGMCDTQNSRPARILAKVESAATVFAGELQAIHDLLYRPQHPLKEQVLESILASLAAGFRELGYLLSCMPLTQPRSATLQANLRELTTLANEICSECVPHKYASALKSWMDQIQDMARQIK